MARFDFWVRIFVASFLIGLWPSFLSAEADEAGVMLYVGDHVVKDFRPQSELVVPSRPIEKPMFPVIDVHCHFGLDADPVAMIEAMNERGVRAVVNLSGGSGDHLDRMLKKFNQFSPDRFLIFCNVDFSKIDEPGFGPRMARFLEQAHKKGARGLKVFKNLGLTVQDSSGRRVAIDDLRIDPLWAKAGELHMPVLIHTADPVAFFQPVDRFNERWMQLKRHPDWSFYGPDFPSRDQLLKERNRVIERHPGTVFIGAHVGNSAEDLEVVSSLLKDHGNFFVDISGRVGELGRQPYSAREFLIEHQDRVLFGTDRYPGRFDQPRYRIYYRFLETQDEYFDYYKHPFPTAGGWKIYGVYLPDEVLRKVYHQNAERIFGIADDGCY